MQRPQIEFSHPVPNPNATTGLLPKVTDLGHPKLQNIEYELTPNGIVLVGKVWRVTVDWTKIRHFKERLSDEQTGGTGEARGKDGGGHRKDGGVPKGERRAS